MEGEVRQVSTVLVQASEERDKERKAMRLPRSSGSDRRLPIRVDWEQHQAGSIAGFSEAKYSGSPCPFWPPQFTPDLLEPISGRAVLPRSHSHYKDFLDLRGDGRVVLYKRADHENPKWTVRLRIPEVPGFVVKSTKTTDNFEARRFAEDLYYRLSLSPCAIHQTASSVVRRCGFLAPRLSRPDSSSTSTSAKGAGAPRAS
jgi:hypothetical protein